MSARGDGSTSGPDGDRFACQLARNLEEKDFFFCLLVISSCGLFSLPTPGGRNCACKAVFYFYSVALPGVKVLFKVLFVVVVVVRLLLLLF